MKLNTIRPGLNLNDLSVTNHMNEFIYLKKDYKYDN